MFYPAMSQFSNYQWANNHLWYDVSLGYSYTTIYDSFQNMIIIIMNEVWNIVTGGKSLILYTFIFCDKNCHKLGWVQREKGIWSKLPTSRQKKKLCIS